jgi:hypothetical protein
MNCKRHLFWARVAIFVAFAVGGGAWFLEIAVIDKPPEDAAGLVNGITIGKMFAYPMLAMIIAWLVFRFPLMPRCDACGTRLRFRREGTYKYACPRCGASHDTGENVTGAGE